MTSLALGDVGAGFHFPGSGGGPAALPLYYTPLAGYGQPPVS
jgi:hypothetical protein